ncbi:MAG: FKBP-type peptidyl-prolyl cis-trans isomerase [Methanobacteriota archaeon]
MEKDTIVRVEFEAWTTDGEFFDATDAEVAKKADAYDANATYGPLPVILGAGRILPGFEEALLGAKVGEAKEIVVPSDKAFGPRDAAKIEVFSLREFQRRELEPRPGERVRIDNRVGTIVQVTAGRVRVDFNPQFAGKDLKYTFKILGEAKTPDEKVAAVLDADYGQDRSSQFTVKLHGKEVELLLPDSCKYDARWLAVKYRVVSDLRTYAGLQTIRFIEEYREETPADAKPPAAGTEGKEGEEGPERPERSAGHEGHSHEGHEHGAAKAKPKKAPTKKA